MKLDCEPGYITLVWTDNRAQTDMSLFRLGNCFPISFSSREVVFRVDVNDCNLSRMVCDAFNGGIRWSLQVKYRACPSQVTGEVMVYSGELVYMPLDQSQVEPFSRPVVCTYLRWVLL